MEWTLVKTEVWLKSVDVVWTREIEGLNQRLFVCIAGEKISATASQWALGFDIRTFVLNNIEKRYLLNQSEITALWELAYFTGERA